MKRGAIFFPPALLLMCYLLVFSLQEQCTSQNDIVLAPPLPTIMYQASSGFFKQLTAEMLFVKTAVFNGNNLSSVVMERNAASLSLNLDVATSLYPQFIDPYYLCQATLPSISPKYAAIANDILKRCEATDEHGIIIPFFRGFNLFYHMDQPQQAAAVFTELAKRDGAPSWFGHFASILSARGGNLYAGLITLQSMLAVETNDLIKQRYQDDILVFKKAIVVQEATQNYFKKYSSYPPKLIDLVPEFLPDIPSFTNFTLKWNPPVLKLKRPNTGNKRDL